PLFYEANEGLVAKHRDAIPERTGYDATGWTPIMGAEHLELRENVGLVDWSAGIGPIEVSGPGALEHLQWLCTADVDVAIGQVVYSLVLTPSGGVARDITVVRMATDTWWILTGKGNLPAELRAFSADAPDSVSFRDLSESQLAIGLWGPNARAVLDAASTDDVSDEAFPYYTCRTIDVGMAKVVAVRISYVGELGWEFYVPPSMALHVWDTLWEAGRPFDMPAVGVQTVFSARIEKGYRLWGVDATPDHSPAECGLGWMLTADKDVRGRDAALARERTTKVVTLRFESTDSVVYGWEPVSIDGEVVGRVAGGEFGYNVGAFLAHAFVDPSVDVGATVTVRRTGVDHAATVVRGPAFDPANERLRR
ncbi:MAG: aminomethyltransferase family protein, partial [Actinomycetota bacterium]